MFELPPPSHEDDNDKGHVDKTNTNVEEDFMYKSPPWNWTKILAPENWWMVGQENFFLLEKPSFHRANR